MPRILILPLALAALVSLLAAPLPATAQSAQMVFSRVAPSVVSIKTTSSQGSGVAIASKVQGFGRVTIIVTNCHVVKGETTVTVTHKRIAGVGVVTSCDEVRDLALVSVMGEIATVATRAAGSLEVGEAVFAVGSPRGLELSITNGIVSALRRGSGGAAPQIQTTAPISPGSSGGGLFDAQGRLVGITTLTLIDSQALNFAMPSEWIAQAEGRGNVSAKGATPKTVASPPPSGIHTPTPSPPSTARYTKIANNGQRLPASAQFGGGDTDWACTQDDATGLIWELKTELGLRSKDHRYSWFVRNNTSNGDHGVENRGRCHQVDRCDTEKFVADVNTASLCGERGWRMPLIDELKALVDPLQNPAISTVFFPDSFSAFFWSGSSVVGYPRFAWMFNFYSGASNQDVKFGSYYVRLVRAGP